MCGIWFCLGQEQNKVLNNDLSVAVKQRGPDSTVRYEEGNMTLVFHRLAIHDPSVLGLQPFYESDDNYDYILVCNGEIYNEIELRNQFCICNESKSDCSVLLPLFKKTGSDFSLFLDHLRGEYAILLIKKEKRSAQKEVFFATDELGVRPLFYSHTTTSKLTVSSLLKGFEKTEDVKRLSPKHFAYGKWTGEDHQFGLYNRTPEPWSYSPSSIHVCDLLEDCVRRRLSSDRPLGCLLSGGLDSSLVAAIASRELKKEGKRLRTFSIGMTGSPDLWHARLVAEHIDSIHTEFIMEENEGLDIVSDVIWAIESWDTTTIRASVPQYLLAKKISETTDVKVLLNGDGADEAQMGYLYFHRAPSIEDAVLERDRLLRDIHLFDGLRVDRCLTRFGLEARTPFLDHELVGFFKQLPGEFLVPTKLRMEKYFIRKAFADRHPDLLPEQVLWRTKEAFSDGVSPSHKSWFQLLKSSRSNEESFYREQFESFFGASSVIPYRWMPRWCDTDDPSARTLDLYASASTGGKTT